VADRYRNRPPFVLEVLEWGPHARVVEPVKLREWVAGELRGALAHYQLEDSGAANAEPAQITAREIAAA
jgi:hypothetical protein